MRKAPLGRSEAQGSTGSATASIAARAVCPYALECRRWIVDRAAERTECAHCYQPLTRSDMARAFEGRL